MFFDHRKLITHVKLIPPRFSEEKLITHLKGGGINFNPTVTVFSIYYLDLTIAVLDLDLTLIRRKKLPYCSKNTVLT